MTVVIESAKDSSRYNWRVQVGYGRGSVIKSRHYKKSAAKKDGKRLARNRGDVLEERMQHGAIRTVGTY